MIPTGGDEFTVSAPGSPDTASEFRKHELEVLRRRDDIAHQARVPSPWIPVQFLNGLHESGTNGVEMKVAYELKEVSFLLHENRLEAILHEMTLTVVAAIEERRVPTQQAMHQLGYAAQTRANQKMDVIRHERPSVKRGIRLANKVRDTMDQLVAILVVDEDIPALDAPEHDVVKRPGVVKAWATRHIMSIVDSKYICQVYLLLIS